MWRWTRILCLDLSFLPPSLSSIDGFGCTEGTIVQTMPVPLHLKGSVSPSMTWSTKVGSSWPLKTASTVVRTSWRSINRPSSVLSTSTVMGAAVGAPMARSSLNLLGQGFKKGLGGLTGARILSKVTVPGTGGGSGGLGFGTTNSQGIANDNRVAILPTQDTKGT